MSTTDGTQPGDETPKDLADRADPLEAGAALGTDGGAVGAIFGLDELIGRGVEPAGDRDTTMNAGEDAGTTADEPVDVSPWNELGGRRP